MQAHLVSYGCPQARSRYRQPTSLQLLLQVVSTCAAAFTAAVTAAVTAAAAAAAAAATAAAHTSAGCLHAPDRKRLPCPVAC